MAISYSLELATDMTSAQALGLIAERFNGEHIILQRIVGQLVLNADSGNWTDGLRLENEIRLPHEIRSLPSPLL